MSKNKKKNRRNIADKVRNNRSSKLQEKKPNPFDFRINKQKVTVLGRNQHKGQVGNPGQARTKANKERSRTLLKELKQSKKSNVFKDQRIGESTAGLTEDEKAIQRLSVVRKAQLNRDKHQNLGEEEVLTHRGQKLSEIEQFEDPVSDSDDENDGRLSGRMVDEHFGGLMTKKSESDSMSWKDKLEQMIAQSKKQKYERQSEKDALQQKREELDRMFKAENDLLLGGKKLADCKPKPDDFHIRVREISFEKKGMPSNRLKTQEEEAKEEAERLQKLEADRKRRMRGDMLDGDEVPAHASADSLDDGLAFGSSNRGKKAVSFANDEDDGEGNESDDKAESENDDDEEEEGSDEDENESSEDDDDESEEDESDDDDEEEVEDRTEKQKGILKNKAALTPEILQEKKQRAEKAKQEVPYTFEAPGSFDELDALLGHYNPEDQLTVVERLVACHHPSLKQGNKEKLVALFSQLLQYLCEKTGKENPGPYVKLYDRLTPVLWKLMSHNTEAAGATVLQLLQHKIDEYQQMRQNRKGRGKFMGLDTMLLLKLIHVLYPTSDFVHHIVTPALTFIVDMLGQSSVANSRDVATGIFLCSLCKEYVAESKRYVAEVIKFLHGCLFLASNKDAKKVEKVYRPFKAVGFFTNLLKVKEKVNDAPKLSLKAVDNYVEKQELDSDLFRASCISTTVRLLQDFRDLYSDLPAVVPIFADVRSILEKLPTDLYPQGLKESILYLQSKLKEVPKLQGFDMEKNKPKILKMLEPKIDETFDGRKKRTGTREELTKQRLMHKIKREKKGALREIRKDARFLSKQNLQETLKNDEDRQSKLKRIYADLSTQEGEVRAIKRKKDFA